MKRYTLDKLQSLVGLVITDSPSPAGNWLCPRLLKVEQGFAAMEVIIQKEMCNPYGNIHGGMMSLVIDEAIGWAIIAADLEFHYTSVSLNVDFLYAAALNEVIVAEALVVRSGKKIVNTEVHVYNQERKLLAHATSNLVVTGMTINHNQ